MRLTFTIGSTNIGGGVDVIDLGEEKPQPEPVLEHCIFCEAEYDLNNLHPGHIKYFGSHPKVCRECGFNFSQYAKIWSDDLERRIREAKMHAGEARSCFKCGKSFNLLGSFYRRYGFEADAPMLKTSDPQWGAWTFSYGLDFLYPNLYTSICPWCFRTMFVRLPHWTPEEQLAAVRELGEKIGKLPESNFTNYMYSFSTREDIEWFLQLMERLPNPELLSARFGSHFRLLVASGLLPEGTRRMRLGTMVLAKDGDMCFSLAERDIDDWLSRNKVNHEKEVRYPGSYMRCDWEIFGCGRRVFVEYLGLMNQEAYAKKAEQKRQMAKENGIDLVEILPGADWEKLLEEKILRTTGRR